jgi:hypothetical protein
LFARIASCRRHPKESFWIGLDRYTMLSQTAPGSRGPMLRHVCPSCGDGRTMDEFRRRRILQLLGLFEHPDALPADLALRLGAELLLLTENPPSMFSCDSP